MKTIEELLENISDDMELFGENRFVYVKRDETGSITDYDFMSENGYTESFTLLELYNHLSEKPDRVTERVLLVVKKGAECRFFEKYAELVNSHVLVIPYFDTIEEDETGELFRKKKELADRVEVLDV